MIVERIRTLLKEKKIFAKDMLKELGINKDQLKRWEDPNAVIKPIYINAIAQYLGTTADYLMGITDIVTEEELISEQKETLPEEIPAGLDEIDIKIINRLLELSDEQKTQALTYMEFLQRRTDSKNP